MRLGTEQLLESFEQTNDRASATNEASGLKIVTDTINPSIPQPVGDVVSVDTSAHKSVKTVLQDTVRKTRIDSVVKTPVVAQVRSSDTLQQSLREKPKRDSVAVVRSVDRVRLDSVSRQRAVEEVTPAEVYVDVNSASIQQVLTIDSSIYVVDSVCVDTLEVTDVNVLPTYSLDGQKEGNPLPISLDRSDGIFALLLFCFLLLAHVYNGGVSFFRESIKLVFSASKSEKLEAQATTKEMFYSYFLVFLAVLLISISLYEALERVMPTAETEKRPFVTIGMFIVLILVFILLKLMFNNLIGYVFDIPKKLKVWNRSYLVLLSILGLLCFLPTLMLVYSSHWHSIIIGFVLVLFLIVQLILFLRIIVFFIERRFNFLYLIAYLCTIEILPYVFLGIGLVYLYRIDIFNTIL